MRQAPLVDYSLRTLLSGENSLHRTKYNTNNQLPWPFGRKGWPLRIQPPWSRGPGSRVIKKSFPSQQVLTLHLYQHVALLTRLPSPGQATVGCGLIHNVDTVPQRPLADCP